MIAIDFFQILHVPSELWNPEGTKTDGANSHSKSFCFFQERKFKKIFFVKKLEIINNMIQKKFGVADIIYF